MYQSYQVCFFTLVIHVSISHTLTPIFGLAGQCLLNFNAVQRMMSDAAIDCVATFAPYLANVVCCPQVEATLTVLIGQSSKYSKELALNGTSAKHCISDFQQILESQGCQ